jgi:hypothetical protein
MPAAAAYARTLLTTNKAVLRRRPALSAIQLTHAVPEPVLHPILLGVVMHPPHATLAVVSEHQQGTVLARCVVDAPFATTGHEQDQAVLDVAKYLQSCFPISHIVLVEPRPTGAITPEEASLLALHLAQTGCPVTTFTGELSASAPPSRWVPPALYHTFRALITQRGHTSAGLTAYYQPTPPTPTDVALSSAVVRARVAGHVVTGLALPDAPLRVRIPVSATNQGVAWATRQIAREALLRVWPWEPVAVLPVAVNLSAHEATD